MNRLQFLVELKNSLFKATKEITLPLISEELEKVDVIADELVGIEWHKLEGIAPATFSGIQEYFINNRPIILFSNGEGLKAYEKICSSCNSLIYWIAYDRTIKCFSCDQTFSIELEAGDLTCKRYYLKENNGAWFIGG